jgi:hypothetical protein
MKEDGCLAEQIVLEDKHPTQNVVCQFYQHDIYFQPHDAVNMVQSQRTNTLGQPQIIYLPLIHLYGGLYNPTYYHINCTIPLAIPNSNDTLSTSGIHLYEIHEYGDSTKF